MVPSPHKTAPGRLANGLDPLSSQRQAIPGQRHVPESFGDNDTRSQPRSAKQVMPHTVGAILSNMVFLELITIVVDKYDPAIAFFVDVLGFELAEDSPSQTNDGRPKRWVVVRPPGAETGILLAQADGENQARIVGDQVAGRVGFFLRVDDFEASFARMTQAGVEFVTAPRAESYGWFAVFLDIAGNRWDLLGPI